MNTSTLNSFLYSMSYHLWVFLISFCAPSSFYRSLHCQRPYSSDKNGHVYWSADEFKISSSNGSVRYPFQCPQATGNFESVHSFKTNSCGECSFRSMKCDYYASSQENQQTSRNEMGSLVSIGFEPLEERSLQSSSCEPRQMCKTSEHKLQSLTNTIPNDTQESIHDSKLRRRNIFRRQLLKWNIIQDNQVGITGNKVIDGETLVQIGRSKDLLYYYVENGIIGNGGYGSVYKGYAIKGTEKTPVAVKFVKYTSVVEYYEDKDLGQVPSEVYFLKKMRKHPNVIKFLHYQRISPDEFVIITERPTHCKDLYDIRSDRGGFFTENEIKNYVKTLVDVVLTMERKNIVHRDLKLENILYDFEKDDIKLIDFGLAAEHESGKLFHEFAGTAMNVPPEYVKHGLYDPSKEAVRSIGVVIYQMLYGRAPYKNYKTFSDVISGLPQFDNVSDELKNFLTNLYAMDPKDRPSITQVAKHSWLRVTRSFTKQLSSFVRRIFRKRRGSYIVNRAKTAKKSATKLAKQFPRNQKLASQRTNHSQSSVSQLSNHRPTTSHSQLNNCSEHSYSERAIDIGDLTDRNHPVTNSYHAAANQNHLDYKQLADDYKLDNFRQQSYSWQWTLEI